MKVKENCPCYDKDGKMIGWFSRSVAVAVTLFAKDSGDGRYKVLVSQRGQGTPDPEYVGAYNAMCGYLDFGETLAHAAIRETKEETGVTVDTDVVLMDVIDDPEENKRENIVMRFYGVLPNDTSFYIKQFSHEGNEPDEVDDITFLDIDELDDVRWAFGHKAFIRKAYGIIKMNPVKKWLLRKASHWFIPLFA